MIRILHMITMAVVLDNLSTALELSLIISHFIFPQRIRKYSLLRFVSLCTSNLIPNTDDYSGNTRLDLQFPLEIRTNKTLR